MLASGEAYLDFTEALSEALHRAAFGDDDHVRLERRPT